jgi:hypothetical protein
MTANGVSNFEATNEEVCTGHDDEEIEHGGEHPCASQEISETATEAASRSSKMAVFLSALCSIGFIVASLDTSSALIPWKGSPQGMKMNPLRPFAENLDSASHANIAMNANRQTEAGEHSQVSLIIALFCYRSSFVADGLCTLMN